MATDEDSVTKTGGSEQECLEPGCEREAKYVAESPDGAKIPVCYKHSLQFARAKVRSLDTDTDQSGADDR